MRTAILDRFRLLGWSIVLTVLAVFGLVLLILTVVGAGLIVVWVGLPILLATLLFTRPLANAHRRWAAGLLGTPIESPYLTTSDGNIFRRLRALARERATWRDLAWLTVNSTVGLALSIASIVEAVLDLLFWWLPKAMLAHLHAYLSRALLAPTEKIRLAQRVEQLTESRAETVDTQAAELRRIERDLHDGAQARLVSLGMSLGLAEEQMDSNPESARQLLADARTASSAALQDLRDLVRGIHPPVLADRGLVGAVQALALASALPVEITADVPGRLPAPVESAAYFAIAEALTNTIKHSHAQHVAVTLRHANELLEVTVTDDGLGGASMMGGTGLRGMQKRLSAFDGKLIVSSPPGGPTIVTMELPCATSGVT